MHFSPFHYLADSFAYTLRRNLNYSSLLGVFVIAKRIGLAANFKTNQLGSNYNRHIYFLDPKNTVVWLWITDANLRYFTSYVTSYANNKKQCFCKELSFKSETTQYSHYCTVVTHFILIKNVDNNYKITVRKTLQHTSS